MLILKSNIEVDATVLVVDAMTGQDAVNVAQTFAEKVGIDGVILTKMDGDTRGGAALSIKVRNWQANPVCRYGREAYPIWNSFIRRVWHPVSLVWEM